MKVSSSPPSNAPERESDELSLFSFSQDEIDAICAAGTVRQCQSGEILFHREEIGDSMYVLESGEIELLFGEDMPNKSLSDGDIFGELAFITGGHRRTATARAARPCRLRVIDAAASERLFAARPRLFLSLMRRTCGYLLASESRLSTSLRRKNRELEQNLDYLRRTREEVDYQELLANTDELTGLYNRRCLDRQLDRFIGRSRSTGVGLALILVDADDFKDVNDTWGHPAGDAVLRAIASVLTSCVRTSDLPCRFGGDEFAVVLNQVEPAKALDRAEAIRRRVAALVPLVDRPKVQVTVSVGGTMLRPGETAAELFERADRELYRAKQAGRNRVSWDGSLAASEEKRRHPDKRPTC